MSAVATGQVLDQAVAAISGDAFPFLRAVHDTRIDDVQARADARMHQLREFARAIVAELHDLPAYQANSISWRAVARLGGATIDMRSQAG